MAGGNRVGCQEDGASRFLLCFLPPLVGRVVAHECHPSIEPGSCGPDFGICWIKRECSRVEFFSRPQTFTAQLMNVFPYDTSALNKLPGLGYGHGFRLGKSLCQSDQIGHLLWRTVRPHHEDNDESHDEANDGQKEPMTGGFCCGRGRGRMARCRARLSWSTSCSTKELLHPLGKGWRRLTAWQTRPLNVAKLVRDVSLTICCDIEYHRKEKCNVIRHVVRPLHSKFPLTAKIAFGSCLRVGGDHRHKQRTLLDLSADALVPSIAAPKLAPVEPDLDPGPVQGLADALSCLCVLRGVA